jgi:hypothetical protein
LSLDAKSAFKIIKKSLNARRKSAKVWMNHFLPFLLLAFFILYKQLIFEKKNLFFFDIYGSREFDSKRSNKWKIVQSEFAVNSFGIFFSRGIQIFFLLRFISSQQRGPFQWKTLSFPKITKHPKHARNIGDIQQKIKTRFQFSGKTQIVVYHQLAWIHQHACHIY